MMTLDQRQWLSEWAGVPGTERNILCFPGTFFTRADLQSLRLYHFTDGWHPFVVAAEVVYFLFLLYYMVMQVRNGLVAPWARDGDGGVPVPSPTISLFPRVGSEGGGRKGCPDNLMGSRLLVLRTEVGHLRGTKNSEGGPFWVWKGGEQGSSFC